MPAARIFLLSPANCTGRRASMLLRAGAEFDLARKLRTGALTLGDAFAFMSGLYFRGKLAYARRFGTAPAGVESAIFVITPTRGLLSPDLPIEAGILKEFRNVDLGAGSRRFRAAMRRDLMRLREGLPADARVVLLGSIATGKYVDVLHPVLGSQLHYPHAFIGRGDMSRGGLLLRNAASGTELEYTAIEAGERLRGRRPPKLTPRARAASS